MRESHGSDDVAIDVADAEGRKLGEVRVAGHTIGPRSRKLTLSIRDSAGSELARLEARDKRGEELVLAAGGSTIATVRVERMKVGFFRKSRVYTAELIGEAPEPVRLPGIAGIIRYEAMLNEVEGLHDNDSMDSSMSDSMGDF